jgi:hypothetical protein
MFNPQNLLATPATSNKSRSPFAACLTHVLHDGCADQLYALLPVWQAQFGSSYTWGSWWFGRSTMVRWADFTFQPIALPLG